MIRDYLRRRTARRRLADWAWQRQCLVLAQLSSDVRMAISAVHISNVIGAMVPDTPEILHDLVDEGLADYAFGGSITDNGYRQQGTRYYLTPAGLDERYRRCGR